METDFPTLKYHCDICDYHTSRKQDFNRHVLTAKHKCLCALETMDTKSAQLCSHRCKKCGKNYKSRSGHWKHMKMCSGDDNDSKQENFSDMKDLISTLITENKAFRELLASQQKQLSDLIPKIGNNNNNTNTNNTNNTVNQKFNIKMFLNEECKDAMNMSDFVKNIEITMANLDTTRYKGLAEGLSSVIIENMNDVSLHERPFHCTDLKREAVYIKNEDVWARDNNEKTNFKKAINDISIKQFKTLQTWTHENPGFKEDDKKTDYFTQALLNVSKDPSTIYDKVIKKVCGHSYLKDQLE